MLQPDSPNMPIDALMYQSTFESNLSAPIGPVGEVWYTYSRIGGIVMHYLTVVDLESEYIVTLKDFHHIIRRSNAREYDSYWVVDNRDRNNIVELSSETPLVLTACKLPEFSMFTIVGIEVDNGKWTLQGEVDKWTSGSSSRFVDAYLDADRDLVVDITGTVEENVSIGFISQTGESLLVNCRVGNDGKVSVSSNGICK